MNIDNLIDGKIKCCLLNGYTNERAMYYRNIHNICIKLKYLKLRICILNE